jgi:hypothetical protein
MGGINSLPVISQIKSAVQAIGGDLKGAKATQEEFLFGNTCPVLSQVVSAGHAIAGNVDKAREVQEKFLDRTSEIPIVSQLVSAGYAIVGDNNKARHHQEKFLEAVSDVADHVPVVGHTKGIVHYIMGDNKKGDAVMKSASRAVGVITGGAVGMLAAGPVGAAAGGVAGGAIMDSIILSADVIVHGNKAIPQGYGKHVKKIVEAIDGKTTYTFEDGVGLVTQPVLDGVRGAVSGSTAGHIKRSNPQMGLGDVAPSMIDANANVANFAINENLNAHFNIVV